MMCCGQTEAVCVSVSVCLRRACVCVFVFTRVRCLCVCVCAQSVTSVCVYVECVFLADALQVCNGIRAMWSVDMLYHIGSHSLQRQTAVCLYVWSIQDAMVGPYHSFILPLSFCLFPVHLLSGWAPPPSQSVHHHCLLTPIKGSF